MPVAAGKDGAWLMAEVNQDCLVGQVWLWHVWSAAYPSGALCRLVRLGSDPMFWLLTMRRNNSREKEKIGVIGEKNFRWDIWSDYCQIIIQSDVSWKNHSFIIVLLSGNMLRKDCSVWDARERDCRREELTIFMYNLMDLEGDKWCTRRRCLIRSGLCLRRIVEGGIVLPRNPKVASHRSYCIVRPTKYEVSGPFA